jgi:hypothetical protein
VRADKPPYTRVVRAPVPVLWLCGSSGMGKSTVGWELYRQLTRAGVRTGYFDTDQVGICHPAPADDPDNHRVKSLNTGAVWPTYRDAGVQCLVVSGGIDTADLARTYESMLPGAALTLCRLRADRAEHRRRLEQRRWGAEWADQAVQNADMLDESDFVPLRVDTDGLSVADTVALVRARAGGWPPSAAVLGDGVPGGEAVGGRTVGGARDGGARDGGARDGGVAPDAVPLLWLCGPPAVGKSTVGWEIYAGIMSGGTKAAYVDLGQIGFYEPAPADDPENHRVKARNLGAMWPTFRAAGARCVVVSGGISDGGALRLYHEALPDAALTLCRLRAGPDRLANRIRLRGAGGGPQIAGDELRGRDARYLHRFADDAVRRAADLDRTGPGDVCVDTDGRSVREVAELIRAATGDWPRLR